MTAGGRRAKSWEFRVVGCNARLLGRLVRAPAHPESHTQAEGSNPLGMRKSKIPKHGSQEPIRRGVALA
jgi:hypothetical protein